MTEPKDKSPEQQAAELARHAEQAPPGLIREFADFLVHNKAWWITPILIVLLLVAALIFLTSSVAAPFIYPLF